MTSTQVSQDTGKVVWYSHLSKNFPQFVVIYTVKGFSIVNETEIDVFLEFSCFFYDPVDVGNLISGSSAFSIVECIYMGFPGGSAVKNSPANARDVGLIPGLGRFPWRRKWQPTPVFLPGKLRGERSLEGCSPRGHKD